MMNNEIKKNYGFLAIGQFGGNITRQFEAAGYPCIVCNSSQEDLAQVKNAKNKIHFTNANGCHKDRLKSKNLLKTNIESIINEIKSKMPEVTTIFVCASAAGGTGSGCLAATAKILKNELGVNICVVTVLPNKSESFKARSNTIEVFTELEKLSNIGACFILDNDRPTDKLKINEIFFTHLNALLENRNGGENGCVDRGEINNLLETNGMAIISKLSKDNSNIEMLLSTLRVKNIYAPIETDHVVKYLCLMNSTNNIYTAEIYSQIGTPVDEYIGVNAPATVCSVFGLSLPKTRLQEILKVAKTNIEVINKNKESVGDSLFGDDIDFLNVFDSKLELIEEKPKKKLTSLEILEEFI